MVVLKSYMKLPALFVDASDHVLLVDIGVEANHSLEFTVDNMIEVSGEDTAQIGAHHNEIVLIQVLLGCLTLTSTSEGVGGSNYLPNSLGGYGIKHLNINMWLDMMQINKNDL